MLMGSGLRHPLPAPGSDVLAAGGRCDVCSPYNTFCTGTVVDCVARSTPVYNWELASTSSLGSFPGNTSKCGNLSHCYAPSRFVCTRKGGNLTLQFLLVAWINPSRLWRLLHPRTSSGSIPWSQTERGQRPIILLVIVRVEHDGEFSGINSVIGNLWEQVRGRNRPARLGVQHDHRAQDPQSNGTHPTSTTIHIHI